NGGRRVIAAARGEGGAGRGLLAAWLGARPSAAADVERLGDGRLLFRSLRLEGPGGFVAARGGRGLLGGLTLNGSARLANLAAARAGASGAVAANWSASQGGVGKPWTFGFDAAAARFASGLGAEIDRLLGPSPRLRASGDWSPSRLAISDAVLTGAAGSASGAGTVGAGGALAIKLAWTARGPLTVGPVTIGGAASGSGDVVGSLTQPRADVIADFASVDALGTALRKAHLVLTFERQPSAANGRFALAAATDYGPAHAAAAFRLAPGGLDLTGINVAGAGVQLAGAAALRQGEPSSADLTFALSRGEFLTAGHASGRLKIIEAAGGPRVDLEARADEAVLPGGAAISTLRLSAAGPWARLPYRASAEGLAIGAPWSLKGSGLLLQAGASHDLSFAGAGRLRNIDVRTLAPARVTFGPEGQSAHMRLAVASGRAQVDLSRHGEEIAANARLENLGLNLLNPDLVGRFDANLAARGHGETLTGDLEAKLAGAGGRDLRGAAPVDGTITARLVPGRLLMSAALGNSQGLSARGEVSLPAVASAAPFRIALARKQAMRGDFAIDGELKPVWDLMMGADRSLAGRVVASGTLAGTLADPRVTGAATLDRGAFHDSGTGLKLRDVSLRAVLADNAVDVATFKADDGGRGTMAGSGRLSLERAGASNLTVALSGFRLIDNDLAQATGSGRINLERGGDGRVKLAGALMIDRAQISPNPPVATGVTPMEVVEVHRPREMEERFAPRAASAPPIALDVSLRAPRGIFVKGRGLDLELSLDAHVRGTTAAPILTGVARVVRGDYDFAGQRFRIDDTGVVQLGSTAEAIQLDLTATRENPTLTAVVRIQGTAAKPTITLTSTPALPQDEVLSQVLFGASASQLSPLQAAQLASAVSGLATGGGFDVIGGLRNLAHLDRLAIGGDATTGSTIAGGKYITDTVYLELTGGGREGSGAQVEWRVRKHVSLVSRVTSQGDSQVSIRWRKDY
ncbi:MAG: translocation/assembly module TamB domain-containing protein, partial [Caulobacteraceae bacterium]